MGEKVLMDNRLSRETVTIEKMIFIHCKAKHGATAAICSDCQELLTYAIERLQCCKYGGLKPACSKCPIYCYRKDMKEKVIEVMRYSGPRMIYKHPILTLRHLLDTIRKKCPGS